jgi:CO/xanthine dehydrogenase FAD-binding subunit
MKPAPFDHCAPTDVDEVLTLLREHAPDARLLAGGQSLVPLLNFRLSRPSMLIDLNKIPDLAYIRDAGDHIAIGAMTRERAVENSELVRSKAPLLHEATLNIAHLPIRSRGTIGGSIANADPAAEYPAVATALDCIMVARSSRGERLIAAADFFEDVLTTALEPDELLVEIRVPPLPPASGTAFVEIARRHGDFALAGVAAQVTLAGETVSDIRLAACGVGSGPVRLAAAEAVILKEGVGERSVAAAAKEAAEEVDPSGDLHATEAYRRRLTGVMTTRALTRAIERARAS